MNQSDNISELATALSKAQSEIQGAKKDCANPFFKSKYADLSSIWDACREPLTKNGLSVIQTTSERDGSIYLYTTLAHSSGQWIRSELKVIVGKPDIQALGSSLTYCRRYSLAMIAGVCPEDDDGNAGSQPHKIVNTEQKISQTEIDNIRHLLSLCPKGFEPWLLNVIQVKSVEEIPISKYEECIKRIDSYFEDQRLKQQIQLGIENERKN
jgi:hypothetical protein